MALNLQVKVSSARPAMCRVARPIVAINSIMAPKLIAKPSLAAPLKRSVAISTPRLPQRAVQTHAVATAASGGSPQGKLIVGWEDIGYPAT